MKGQPLIGSQGVDMAHVMHLPQIDFALIAVGVAQVCRFQRHCGTAAFADQYKFIEPGGINAALCRKPAQRIALPAWTVCGPCKDIGQRLGFGRHAVPKIHSLLRHYGVIQAIMR